MKLKLKEMNEDDSRDNTGFLSMMYSIQALCEQRLANSKGAELAAHESRRYLTKSDYNIYTKISYAVLSDYYGGEGEDEVAQSYLNHLNRILGDGAQDFEHLLIRAQKACTLEDRGCNGVMSSIVFIFSLYNRENHTFDLKSIEEEINPQNAGLAITVVQQVNDMMNSILRNFPNKYTEEYTRMKHVLHELVFLSGISSVFFSLGLEGEMVDALVDRADELMQIFDPLLFPIAVFPHLSIYMTYRVNRFGNILAEFHHHILNGMDIRSIFCLEKFQKYFNGIVHSLKMMNEFSKRYKRINKRFGQLNQNLQTIAKWKFDVQSHIIPNALLEDIDSSNNTTTNTVQSPFIPETPVNISSPIPMVSKLVSNAKESSLLYNSCLERAKLNYAFNI
ncbi:predicted protein [Naegleria gruberi]|uniref:Predicted protein n=1 Tax=Naegleria gruberi TaxID=5762 RepID=D2VSX0_NAEGR|nr:uncharacterized protein NAEGRDRAFT_51999 [Naegleria gruberi]EFC40051.1 predicted protein [Naegleria gruberi]|eukprot:XP_002672795.1 predicted protein [Naegleria gruberi strain NEG-M]